MTRIIPTTTLLLVSIIAMPAYAQAQPFGGGDPFASADANGDGDITRAEFRGHREAGFSRLDRNGDGVVTKSDFSKIARFRPEAAQRLEQMIALADADHDGKLTKAELAAAPAPIFDRADGNGDGVVSKAEAEAARAAIRQLAGKRTGKR